MVKLCMLLVEEIWYKGKSWKGLPDNFMLIRPDHLHCQLSQWKHFHRINLSLNTNKHPTKAPGFSNHFTKPQQWPRQQRGLSDVDICYLCNVFTLPIIINIVAGPSDLTWYLYLQNESKLSLCQNNSNSRRRNFPLCGDSQRVKHP